MRTDAERHSALAHIAEARSRLGPRLAVSAKPTSWVGAVSSDGIEFWTCGHVHLTHQAAELCAEQYRSEVFAATRAALP